ncbi:hypothetical protein JXB37_04190 [candidate division WOR-3 bacterium]|nr:hypothetical protein [candidate division WOR-3 bacterium]
MKTWMWVLVVALAVSVTVNLAAIGTIAARRLSRVRRSAPEWVRRARPESREELRELQRELGNQMDSLRQELAGEQRGLAMMLRRAETTEAEADSAAARIGRLHTALTRQAFDFTRRALRELTPEQQEKLLLRFERQYDRPPHHGRRSWRHGGRDRHRFDGPRYDSSPGVQEDEPGDECPGR